MKANREILILAATVLLVNCTSPERAGRQPTSTPLLSEKVIDSAPIRMLQSGNKSADEAALIKLFREIGKKDGNDFLDYITLFPARFRLIPETQTQGLVDNLVTKIIQTDTGKKSFCFLTSDDAKYIPYYLGVSKDAAKEIKKICAGQPMSATQKIVFTNMRSTVFPGDSPAQRQKKIFFLVSESGAMPVEAFSTKENTSLFILLREELNETQLLRMISHEFAMSYDQLVFAAQMTELSTWETGISIIFDKTMFSLEDGHYSTFFKKPNNQDEIRCAMNDPALKYAMAAERAFRFEDKIMSDLGIDSPTIGAPGKCAEAINRWLPSFPSMYPAVVTEVKRTLGFLENHCGEVEDGIPLSDRPILKWGAVFQRIEDRLLNPSDPKRVEFLKSRLRTLSETILEPKDGSPPQPLCEFLLNPKVGPRYVGFYGGGPRPRPGGWQ